MTIHLVGVRFTWKKLEPLLMQPFSFFKYTFLSWALLLLFSACNTTKYLKEDEFLLKKNSVKILAKPAIKNKSNLTYELSTLYKQKPNTNFLIFFPREWFYFKLQDPGDTTRFDRWQKRVIAEVPTIYKENLADSTARSMEYYLQYNGYYNATVVPDDRVRGKKVSVTYFVYPYQQFTIDTVVFSSEDTSVHRILQEIKAQSVLKENLPLTRTLYEQERDRITTYLRNHGFAYFYSNNIAPLDVDTTEVANKAKVYLQVLSPPGDSSHHVYRVGKISVYSQYDPIAEENLLKDTIINNIRFVTPNNTFKVKPQVITNSIFLKEGDLYSQENYDKTVKQLSALGVYRFVRVQESLDSLNARVMNFVVELTRNPRMETGVDLEVSYTNRSATAVGNLIGISVSPSLRNRNLFRGAEVLVTNVGAGVEVNPSASVSNNRFWNTIDLRAQAELFLPRFSDYLGVWRGLNQARVNKKSGIITDDFYQLMRESATTRFSLSYNYLLLIDFYRYQLFNASYGYDIRRSNNRSNNRYLINHVGIDYLRPTTDTLFEEIKNSNPFLERSFGKQLFVSLLFRDLTYTRTTRANRAGVSNYFGLNVEVAGAEVWAVNSIYNAFSLVSDTLKLGDSDFSQYAKLEGAFHWYKSLTPKSSLAARLSLGVARPFGYTTDVPYVKQFSVGGPNSIRGWAIRELGPGGYVDSLTLDIKNRGRNRLLFYQTGDLKLEFNAEYRFPLFLLLNGAIFLDAGNVWTLKNDAQRPGSQFLLRSRTLENTDAEYKVNDAFYKQIALNTGFGLRMDLSYFVIRLDAGIKLRSPYPIDYQGQGVNANDYWYNFKGWGINDVNFNLGLGYPF